MRHRSFRRLYAGFVVQQLGFWTSHVALQGVVHETSENDPVAMGVLFAALLGPTLVFGPLAGVIADRRDRRVVLIQAYAITGIAATGLTLLITVQPNTSLLPVYGLSILLGIGYSLISPALGAGVADTVSVDDLQSAISMQAASTNITRVGGPMVAAALIAARNYEIAFGAFALSCVFAAAALQGVRFRPYERDASQVSVLARLRDGLRHAQQRPPAMRALRTVAVTSVFGVAHVALVPSFTSQHLGASDGQFAWVFAGTGVGAIGGALVLGYVRRPVTLIGGAGAQVIFGLALTGFALSSHLWVAITAQILLGFFYFMSMTWMQALLQNLVDNAKRARVMSLFTLAWGGVVWVGTLLMGLAAGPVGLGLRPTLLLAAAICVAHGALTVITTETRSYRGAGENIYDK